MISPFHHLHTYRNKKNSFLRCIYEGKFTKRKKKISLWRDQKGYVTFLHHKIVLWHLPMTLYKHCMEAKIREASSKEEGKSLNLYDSFSFFFFFSLLQSLKLWWDEKERRKVWGPTRDFDNNCLFSLYEEGGRTEKTIISVNE